jgi:hypothetical protein
MSTRSEIAFKVKAMMDELTTFPEGSVSLPSGTLVNPISRYIDALLDEATDSVQLAAPTTRLLKKNNLPEVYRDKYNTGTPATEKLSDGKTVYYTVPMPADFLRVAEVRMEDWERPVFGAVLRDDEEYKLLRNPYTTPGAAKPAVAQVDSRLELYGSRVAGKRLLVGRYVYKWYFTAARVDMARPVEDAICWRCAMLTLSVMERGEAKAQAERFYNDALARI